jgi:hypothetical protein
MTALRTWKKNHCMSQTENTNQDKPKCDQPADPKPKVDKEKLEQSIKDKQKAINSNQTVNKNEQANS